MVSFKKFFNYFTLLTLVISLVAPGLTMADAPNYVLTLTNKVITGFQVNLNGTGLGNPYVGQFDQHAVKVDWGDGVIDLDVPNTFVDNTPVNNAFSGGWSAQHTYATSGTYSAKAQLYHQNSNGAEGSVETIITVGVVIPPQGTLNVIKHVVNDGGGTKTAADFTMNVTGTGVTPSASFAGSETATTVDLTPGTYSVDETDSFGYTKNLSTDCAGTIADGEIKTCTITNTFVTVLPDPKLTVVKIVNNYNGGTKLAADFPLFVCPTGTSVCTNQVTSAVSNTYTAGNYNVSETSSTGYAATFSGACDSSGNVTLAAGEDKTCTITNNDVPATLTVTKVVINDSEGTAEVKDFPLSIVDNNPTSPNYNVSFSLTSGESKTFNAGIYKVSEVQKEGYTGSFSGDCNAEGEITLAVGDVKSCTLTNNDNNVTPPTKGNLVVIKNVINDNDGDLLPGDFTMLVTATNASQTSFPGSANGTVVTVDPGSYIVDEATVAGYTKSLGANCSGTIAAGDTKTCTITNDDIAPEIPAEPQLTVVKVVINDNGGTMQVSNFPLYVCPVSLIPAYQTTALPNNLPCTNLVSSGVAGTFPAGNYKVSEIGNASYAATFSGACDASGNVTLAAGENKTCTITNNDIAQGGGGGSTGGGSTGGGSSGGSGYVNWPTNTTTPPVTTPTPKTFRILVHEVEQPQTEGEVLGEQACSMYITEYIHIKKNNNPDEVKKLKLFLNDFMHSNLLVNGTYDKPAFNAVKLFQKQEAKDVLTPWGISQPTGYVYKTTVRKINLLKCSDLNLPMPSPLFADTNVYDNE